jgi:hypothetical protein
MKRNYDSTVARIAGNIAAGLVSKADASAAGIYGVAKLADWMESVVLLSVGLARGIVAEVERTEPGTPQRSGQIQPQDVKPHNP